MGSMNTCFILIFVIAVIRVHECGRFGGSSRSSGRTTYSRPSSSHNSYSRPSARPSPSPQYRPSRPSPPPQYRPSGPSPPPQHRPSGPSPPPQHRSSGPIPPAHETPVRAVTSRPVQSSRLSTARPNHIGSTPRPYPSQTSRPQQPVHATRYPQVQSATQRPPYHHPGSSPRYHQSVSTTRRPIHYTTPRRINSVGWGNNPNAGWNVPPRPGSGSAGSSTYGGPQKIKIVNKYNYHYPGHYSLPLYQPYVGYYHAPSYYHYGIGDTGSTALGFYLGYSLGKLTTPTYSHYSFYDGYRPRYDHYEVHHYYHNRESVPQRQEIQSNNIIGCVGDTAGICPANTTSLCTSSGALMCVTAIAATMPCDNNVNTKCVTSTISCVNNAAPECKNSDQKFATVSIPCVSNAEIHGELKTVNNTIIPANATLPALNEIIDNNSETTFTNSTNATTGSTAEFSTKYPITTTPQALHTQRRKRQLPQNYCVTVMAVPAQRQSTEGETFLEDAKYITQQFFEKAFNL